MVKRVPLVGGFSADELATTLITYCEFGCRPGILHKSLSLFRLLRSIVPEDVLSHNIVDFAFRTRRRYMYPTSMVGTCGGFSWGMLQWSTAPGPLFSRPSHQTRIKMPIRREIDHGTLSIHPYMRRRKSKKKAKSARKRKEQKCGAGVRTPDLSRLTWKANTQLYQRANRLNTDSRLLVWPFDHPAAGVPAIENGRDYWN